MGSEWNEMTVGEVLTLQRGFDITKKEQIDGPYPVVSSSGVKTFHNEFKVKGPGVVIGRKGTLGTVFFLKEDFWPHDTSLWVKDFKGNEPKFIYYFLQAFDFQKYDVGSSNPTLNRNHVHLLDAQIPPLPTQRAIAHILGSLDDKIALLRKMNETLEQMAQALFQSWFVDFDPVIDKALAAGNDIPGPLQARAARRQALGDQRKALPPEIADLFPDAFTFHEDMGWVPEGWGVKEFGAILENTIGGDWGKESEDEKHSIQSRIIRGTDIPDIKAGGISKAPHRWVEPKKLKSRRLEAGDVVIEVSGGSPKQPTGRSLLITKEIISRLGGTLEPASFCRLFRPLSYELGVYASLHLSFIYSKGKMWEYQNQSTGISNFQTKTFLMSEKVVLPVTEELLSEFSSMVSGFISRGQSNQIQTLASLRDTLLPKLLSGELEVGQVEPNSSTV